MYEYYIVRKLTFIKGLIQDSDPLLKTVLHINFR